MVKTKGPALSLNATGSIKQLLSFGKTKGRSFLKKSSIPKNPRTGRQVGVRSMMGFLGNSWNNQVAGPGSGWDPIANEEGFAPYHAYVQANARRWNTFQAPGQDFPILEDDAFSSFIFFLYTGGVRSIQSQALMITTDNNWGWVRFLSTTSGFATAVDNCIGVTLLDVGGTTIVVDTPVAAGSYFMNTRLFSEHGLLSPEQGEVAVTVTNE